MIDKKIFFIDKGALVTAIVLENYRAICNFGGYLFYPRAIFDNVVSE